ncbi:2-polyprenyl-3-methyl-6-methoxy-1,4-benzoquinone monooxygenase [Wenzhouxiangella marina]|uniref:3-demethoxyubiquinol 3-hydroxylase n=1 Tax=Wenzhouxiangella marina TaxID=1579979 RepID=A0A0K0XTU7_9GAMM|nr:2-polyprenyl-3-methyl-6-methoxy-1,4-benzoquinone monooxygenase [Wenzhouxiangella marina]AKS41047.1 2-nonaprenyl-3-methyl-6-methoxy-1,4-benzoquinol hydroxylase [Wenzhouxiangella marina]MBB6087925.1 ubiquinone biosynthesis monooxygenase Coq7 [Wenzhouxiangella marina]
MRQASLLDRWIGHADQALRVALGPPPHDTQPSPAADIADAEMDETERRHAGGLMRINHTGEVCAQALYAGQAATARSDRVRREMADAAREEEDHLAWCAERLDELGDRPSYLNPLWYAGSFTIGAVAGLAGDRWSLGFVEATERQVESHLDDHLDTLPAPDQRSRAIVARMKEDEARHADMAVEHGARTLPGPVQGLMAATAGLMKLITYRV